VWGVHVQKDVVVLQYFWLRVLSIRVQVLRFGVQGWGVRFNGLGLRVWG